MTKELDKNYININYCVLSGAGDAGFEKPKDWNRWSEAKKRKYINQFIIDFCIDITFDYEEDTE